MGKGASLRDRVLLASLPEPASPSRPSVTPPCAGTFEARPVPETPWLWEVWDIEHEAACNHFPVLRVDSKGAADDCHETIARACAAALSARYPRRGPIVTHAPDGTPLFFVPVEAKS